MERVVLIAGTGVLGVEGELGNSETENTLPLNVDGFFGVSEAKLMDPVLQAVMLAE